MRLRSTHILTLAGLVMLAGCVPPAFDPSLMLVQPTEGDQVAYQQADLVTRVAPGKVDVVSFYGRSRADTPGEEDFTIAILPDTQFYTARNPNLFRQQAQWIVDNREAMNIVAVFHLGDIVDNAAVDDQWRAADESFRILESAPDLAIGIAVGNHDQTPMGIAGGTTNFNRWFPFSRFEGIQPWYGGHFGTTNDNSYILFKGDGLDIVAIFLQFDRTPDADVLAWADGVLKQYPDHYGVVVSHFMMSGAVFNAAYSPQGLVMRNALIDNPNLKLMLCGHFCGSGLRTETVGTRRVHTLLSDYQCWPNGGDGWMRLMTFSPGRREIRVRTYSPSLGQYMQGEQHDFVLSQPLGGTEPFRYLGHMKLDPEADEARFTWEGLAPDTQYEWFVTTNGNTPVVAGPVWSFTTAGN